MRRIRESVLLCIEMSVIESSRIQAMVFFILILNFGSICDEHSSLKKKWLHAKPIMMVTKMEQ